MTPRSRLLATIVVGVAAVVAFALYLGRSTAPDHVLQSEKIVRKFVRTAGQEIRVFQRSLRSLKNTVEERPETAASVVASIDALVPEVLAKLEAQAAAAITRIESLDRISWRTELNRVERIEERLEEMKHFVTGAAEDAKLDLRERSLSQGRPGE